MAIHITRLNGGDIIVGSSGGSASNEPTLTKGYSTPPEGYPPVEGEISVSSTLPFVLEGTNLQNASVNVSGDSLNDGPYNFSLTSSEFTVNSEGTKITFNPDYYQYPCLNIAKQKSSSASNRTMVFTITTPNGTATINITATTA